MPRLSVSASGHRHAWRRSDCEAGLDFDTPRFILDFDPFANAADEVDESDKAEFFPDPLEFEMASKRSARAVMASTIEARPTRPNGHSSTTALARLREVQPLDVVVTPAPTAEQIRERAYQIYLNRAGQPGDPQSDWLQAERELILGRVGIDNRPPMS